MLQLTLILTKIMLVAFSTIASSNNNDKDPACSYFNLLFLFPDLNPSEEIILKTVKALLSPSPTMAVLLGGRDKRRFLFSFIF